MWNVVTIRGGFATREAAEAVARRHALIEPGLVVRSFVAPTQRNLNQGGESPPWWLKVPDEPELVASSRRFGRY